ncbi:MAG: rRNA pseudouridine synthase [Solobacterium sp.]|nr:rRNA pseudouridine synthase [Solobacterium sp.]
MIRLDKALANIGYGSRNEMKRLIKSGRVRVNGEVITNPTVHIQEETDELMIDDKPVTYQKYFYFMLNKPAGVISATEGRDTTVIDLIDENIKGLFPCGRLDKDTEGLLMISNDGELTHQLLSPRNHIEKEYYVEHSIPLSDYDVEMLENGISSGADNFRPAKYEKVSDHACRLVITEGKYHEIKRMFLAMGNQVTYLKRLRMKTLILDPALKPGEYRPLKPEEIKALQD